MIRPASMTRWQFDVERRRYRSTGARTGAHPPPDPAPHGRKGAEPARHHFDVIGGRRRCAVPHPVSMSYGKVLARGDSDDPIGGTPRPRRRAQRSRWSADDGRRRLARAAANSLFPQELGSGGPAQASPSPRLPPLGARAHRFAAPPPHDSGAGGQRPIPPIRLLTTSVR